jgi:hypothetical protein
MHVQACSHYLLAIMLSQRKINSRVQFRANSENLRRCSLCRSIRSLVVCLARVNVTLVRISLPFCLTSLLEKILNKIPRGRTKGERISDLIRYVYRDTPPDRPVKGGRTQGKVLSGVGSPR